MIMVAFRTAVTRLDQSFTYSEVMLQSVIDKFIGLRVLPVLSVQEEAATNFEKLDIQAMMNKVEDTRRRSDGSYSRDTYEMTTDSYALTEHGVEERVDEAKVERYGSRARVEGHSSLRAIHRVLQRLEYDIAAAVFNTTTFTGASLTTAVSNAWTVHASGTPHADVMAAHQNVEDNSGHQANTLVLPSKAWRNALQCAEIEDLLKYDAFTLLLDAYKRKDALAIQQINAGLNALFQVDQILIGRSFQNTADKGQTGSLSPMWTSTMAMLCVVNDDGPDGQLESLMPTLGRTLFSTRNSEPIPGDADSGEGSLIFEEYYEPQVRSNILRPRNKRQVKVLQTTCGHLLTAVTA
jgi:hypothetical protein